MVKKATVLCIIIFTLMLITALIFVPLPVYDGAYVGMSDVAFHDLFPSDKAFHYYPYSFYTNSLGDYVVARFYDGQIVELKCIRKLTTNPSDATFNRIKEGTNILDVVSMVGIPVGSYTSGMATCYFYSNSGSQYTIYWNSIEADNGIIYVSSSVLPHQ